MPSVFIKTYGCQMNERDSEAVAAQLVTKGYSMTTDALRADVILLNTCSVRDAAEQKALGKMNHVAAQLRSKNRKAVLGFMGCMAQSRGRELIDRLPDVDLVVGTQKFHRTADYIGDLLATGGTAAAAASLVARAGGQVVEAVFLVELGCLDGRAKMGDVPVRALVRY